jgi:hypothetical protein
MITDKRIIFLYNKLFYMHSIQKIFDFNKSSMIFSLCVTLFFPFNGYSQLTQKWNRVITSSPNMKFEWPIARYVTGRDNISISKSGAFVGVTCNAGTSPYVASFSTIDGSVMFQNTHSISGSGGGIDYDSTDNLYALSRVNLWGDSYLRKFSQNGTLSYTKTIANYNEDLMFMLSVNGGRVNVFGKNKNANHTNTHSNYNYTLDGTLKWQSTISDYDWFYGYTVPFVADRNGNVFMTGKRQVGSDPQAYDAVVRKLDSNGVQKWQIYIDQANRQDYVLDIITDAVGDVYASIDNGGTIAMPSYVVKINGANGNIVWRRTFTRPDNIKLSTMGGRLFVMEEGGLLYALDVSTGNIIWSTRSILGSYTVETDSRGISYASSANSDSIRIVNFNGQVIRDLKVIIPGYTARIESIAFDEGAKFFYVSGICIQGSTSHLFLAKYETPYTDSLNQMALDTVGVHVAKVNAVCNNTVDVPVRVTAFRNMLTMQGSLNWNAADLRLDSISGYGPASMGMDVANFGLTQAGNGRMTFSWNEASGNGLSLADSTTIFTMRFTALGTTVRSIPITVTGTPTVLEFYDAALVKKTTELTAGAVNITCEFTISGKVLTPTENGVRNVAVTLSGGSSPLTAITDTAGNYSFKILPGTYTLTPTKTYEQYKTNGVSTLDIALIQAHVLQRTPFNAAYKVIAGDANNSSGVTTADILFLRRLILGTDTTLPNNRIWAFVDGGQTFSNPLAPFPFSSTKTLTNQSTDITHTFRGIKIGDVNYDRNPLLDQAPSGDTLRLFGEWTDTEDGYATLRVKSRTVEGLLGWQSSLKWDPKQLQLQHVSGLINNLGIGERWKDEGYLTLSWNDPRAEGLSFTEGVAWMELKFRKTGSFQRAGVGITEEKLGTEAFNGNYQSMGVKMEPGELRGNAWNGMLRVYPNPATQYLNIEWKSSKNGSGQLRLIDAQGRVVHQQETSVVKGVNKARIDVPVGLASGSFIVQVIMGVDVNAANILIGK